MLTKQVQKSRETYHTMKTAGKYRGIKGNEASNKVATCMQGTELPDIDYFPEIRRTINSKWQRK